MTRYRFAAGLAVASLAILAAPGYAQKPDGAATLEHALILAAHDIDRSMQDAETYLIEPAKAVQHATVDSMLPKTRAWISSLAMGVRHGEIETAPQRPEPEDHLSGTMAAAAAAQAELEPFRKPFPPTKDLEAVAAQKADTNLSIVSEAILTSLHDAPASVREKAADYLISKYRPVDRRP